MPAIADPAEIAAAFEAAWNAHDMEAFATLFWEEATFVNRVGSYWRGRDDVVAGHAHIHRGIYRDTTIQNRVQTVDPIAEGVVIVHVRSNARFGEAMRAGHPKEISAQFMYVATRRDGEWRIQAGMNVALVDPETGKFRLDP